MVKVTLIMCILFFSVFGFCGCNDIEEEYGSFVCETAYSFDNKYHAEIVESDLMIGIKIVDDNNSQIFYFEPVRRRDFWGICWEEKNYNLWIQSGDVGVICYKYHDDKWSLDSEAVRPDSIHSKYD